MIPALTVCQAGLRWAERPSSELSSSNNWLGSFTGESTGRVSFRVYFLHPNQINSWNFPPLGIKVAAHEVIQLCHSYQNRKCWSNLAPFKSQDSALAILYFFFFFFQNLWLLCYFNFYCGCKFFFQIKSILIA